MFRPFPVRRFAGHASAARLAWRPVTSLPPGWYPDHHDPRLLRWWDGNAWSYHVQPRPGAAYAGPAGVPRQQGTGGRLVVGVLIGIAALVVLGMVAMIGIFIAIGSQTSSSDTGSATPSSVGLPADEGLPGGNGKTWLVTRVVDGDTVELANGEHVRLGGIDSPEVGECGYAEATAAMVRLVEGKRVVLVRSDEDDRDRYDRLLRYVDVDGTDAGLRLIRLGLAIARYDSRDGYGRHPREDRYIAADRRSPDVTCA